ncbi:MAG: peptidylprolyl isomerase [Spirochaetaceae bacterium]|nr:peptidylprolyl isomerase [Spirochaetaceae bacterium]
MSSNASQKTETPKHRKSNFVTVGSIIILVLAAISFIFLPGMFGGKNMGQPDVLGYYRKEPVKTNDELFIRHLEQQIEQSRQYGMDINEPGNYMSALYEAFNATVTQKAFAYEVKKSGYIVPESAISRAIINTITQQKGSYSPKDYNQLSNSDKLKLRNSVLEDLIHGQYYDDFFGAHPYGYPTANSLFGLKVSSKEVPFAFNMNSPERSFEIAAFNMSNYPNEELVKFANEHASLFKTLNFEIITVSTKAEAEKIAKRIANNEITFDDAVNEYSNKNFSDANGILANNTVYKLKKILREEDFEEVLKLGVDSLSGVVETGSFFSILKCCDTAKEANFDSPEALDAVYSYITSEEPKIIEDYFMAKARDFAADAAVTSFDAACAKYGVAKQTPTAFPLNYASNNMLKTVDSDTAVLAGASTNENFLKTAFSLKLNEISSPVMLRNNILVLKLVEETNVEEELLTSMAFFYPINAMRFDSSTITNHFSTADYVKNDVISVYLSSLD